MKEVLMVRLRKLSSFTEKAKRYGFLSISMIFLIPLSGCFFSNNVDEAIPNPILSQRPDWADQRMSSYGYASSAAVYNIGTLRASYAFAQKDGRITGDSLESTTLTRRSLKLNSLIDAIGSDVDTASSKKLLNKHGILLANADGLDGFQDWDVEKAFYLYKTIEDLPKSLNQDAKITSVFYLSEDVEVREILEIEKPEGAEDVEDAKFYKVSAKAFDFTDIKGLFKNAIKAKYFDNDFFKHYIELFMKEPDKLADVIKKRYGYSVDAGGNAGEYRNFLEDELLVLITVLEDLPPFFRPISGLKELLRRNDDSGPNDENAVYNNATIEFFGNTFSDRPVSELEAIIVSSLARAWYNLTLEKSKVLFWQKLSGWKKDSSGNWSSSRADNLVSDEATKGPEEDFAESVAYYVVYPEILTRKAKSKYDFIFSLMDGYQYRITANEKFKFHIISSNPDLTAPVADVESLKLDIYVNDEGYYTVKVGISVSDDISGVSWGRICIYAEKNPKHSACGSFRKASSGDMMEAKLTNNRYSEKGKWNLRYLTFTDNVRNVARYTSENLGWDLELPDNGYPVDTEAPTINMDELKMYYAWNSNIRKHEIFVEVGVEDDHSERLHGSVRFSLEKNKHHVWARKKGYDPAEKKMYFVAQISEFKPGGIWNLAYISASDELGNTTSVHPQRIKSEFAPYGTGQDQDESKAGGSGSGGGSCEGGFETGGTSEYVGEGSIEGGKRNKEDFSVPITNEYVDLKAPKVDISSISVKAINNDPVNNSGSHTVEVRVTVGDDISGVSSIYAAIRSPRGRVWSSSTQGDGISVYDVGAAVIQNGNYVVLNAKTNPAGWGKKNNPVKDNTPQSTPTLQAKEYLIKIRLPAHIEGGEWILSSVGARDRAGNRVYVNLTTRGISVGM